MATASQTPQPSPARIFETLTAHQQTAALKAAIELDVFTAIGEGSTTHESLAQRCGTSERGMRILCDYLVVHAFLTKEGNQYGLPLDSATFLDRRSPAYVGSIVRFMTMPDLMDRFRDLTSAVRKGGTVAREPGLSQESPIWIEFARSMAPLIASSADTIATIVGAQAGEKWKVLDIAAGHGLFSIAVAKKNPQARIVALDWAGVLKVAEENAQRAGVADRFSTIPGSAFEADFGSGYDLVLLTNFLHHFDVPTCENLLRKVHAALKAHGRVATLEFVPNEDRVSPPIPATFSMMMLGMTDHGDAYTFAELERMFRNAGFVRSELHPLLPAPQHLIVSDK
jgi:2-polyprenyl-3-methyl-5-hydroxy-6-metoxy-1,4-benzoquinol methylase